MAESKRLNYFTGQFLVATDFKDEQAYHVEMRRLHNRALHSWGVVQGLQVSKSGDKAVSISRGMAIDNKGREIVLQSDTTVPLVGSNTGVYLVIVYAEEPTDRSGSGGVENDTRIIENCKLEATKDVPPADGSVITLAKAMLDESGNITGSVDNSARQLASSLIAPRSDLGDKTVGTLTFKREGIASNQWPKLACGAAKRLDVSGAINATEILKNGSPLTVSQWVDVTGGINYPGGKVGIGTTAPKSELHVKSLTAIDEGATAAGAWANLGSNAFYDGAWQRIDTSKAGVNLHMNADDVAGQEFRFMKVEANGANLRNVAALGTKVSCILEGNVGIGTVAPSNKLHVNDNTGIRQNRLCLSGGDGWSSLTYNAYHNTANNNWVFPDPTRPAVTLEMDDSQGVPRFHVWSTTLGAKTSFTQRFAIDGNSGNVLMGQSGGNVGIGTTNPLFRLDVKSGGIKLGLEENGGGQLILANNPNDNKIFIEAFSADGSGHASELLLTGRSGLSVPRLTLGAATTFISGNLQVAGGKSGYVVDQFVNNRGETLEEGDVVVIGENQTSFYYGLNNNIPIPEIDTTQRVCDTRICGIVCNVHAELSPGIADEAESGAKTKKTKKARGAKGSDKTKLQIREFTPEELEKLDTTKIDSGQTGWMVTLGAFAHCKVDADVAPIDVGDLLTTSPTKAHAQKVMEPGKAVGAILGKALGSLKKGTGKIPVLVMLQ